MFEFVKKMFFVAMTFFGFSSSNVNSLECISMNNQECKIRPKKQSMLTLMSLCSILSVLK